MGTLKSVSSTSVCRHHYKIIYSESSWTKYKQGRVRSGAVWDPRTKRARSLDADCRPTTTYLPFRFPAKHCPILITIVPKSVINLVYISYLIMNPTTLNWNSASKNSGEGSAKTKSIVVLYKWGHNAYTVC